MDSPILVFIPVTLSISYLLLRLCQLPAIPLPRRFRAQERLQSPSVAIFRNPNTRRKSLLLALSLLLGTAVAWAWTLFLPTAMLLLLLLFIAFTLDEIGEPRRLQELPATLGLISQVFRHVAAGDDLPEALGKATVVLLDGPVQAAAKKALLRIEERLALDESLASLRGVNPYLDEFVSDSLRAGWQHSPALIITLTLLLKRASQYWDRMGSLRARRDRLQPWLPFARGFIAGGVVMGLALLFQPPTIPITTVIVSILAALILRFVLENSTARRIALTAVFIFLLLSPTLLAFPVHATPAQLTRQGSLFKGKNVQQTPLSQSEPVKLRGTFELPECQISTGVPGGFVNLRSGPGMHYPVMRVIPEAEALAYLGQTGNFETGEWRQVMMVDEIGWIYAPLCKTASETEAADNETGGWIVPETFLSDNPATPEAQTVLDSCQIATGYPDGWANLRFGPGMDFSVVATLPELTRLEMLEQAGDFYTTGIWYKVVAPNASQGWIFNEICARSGHDDAETSFQR